MPTDRMGPPPGASPPMRMTASWSGSNDPTAYKFVARRCPQLASSPRILNRQAPSDAEAMQKAPVAVHHRSANRIAGDGTKNGLPAPNKELATNQKQLLD